MDNTPLSSKDKGRLGEDIAAKFLEQREFAIIDRNFSRKTGELDIIARKGNVLHIIEVKTALCNEFPQLNDGQYAFDPAQNLHAHKIRKVSRTAEWYAASKGWDGEIQIDGVIVWLRARDRLAKVRYVPQIIP